MHVNMNVIIHMELITVLVTVGTDWPLIIRLVMVIHSFNFRFSLVLILLDIDECGEHVSGCNQHCVNTVGSYYCSCYTGFQINADQHTCFGRYTTSSKASNENRYDCSS